MFTGIVETIGKVKEINHDNSSIDFIIEPKTAFNDLFIGASVAVNGACLTVTKFNSNNFSVTVVPETLKLTNLKNLNPDNNVNLERPILANSRIGGHYLQGHIETIGKIIDVQNDGIAKLVKIELPNEYSKYIVKKGYIAIDGMSITVIEANDSTFTVTLIPETINATIAKEYRKNTIVNLETDIFGKYIEKFIGVTL